MKVSTTGVVASCWSPCGNLGDPHRGSGCCCEGSVVRWHCPQWRSSHGWAALALLPRQPSAHSSIHYQPPVNYFHESAFLKHFSAWYMPFPLSKKISVMQKRWERGTALERTGLETVSKCSAHWLTGLRHRRVFSLALLTGSELEHWGVFFSFLFSPFLF